MDVPERALMRRRQLIRAFGALSGLSLLPSLGSAKPVRFDTQPFALGVASGSPSADGFVLWTRLAGDRLQGAGPVKVGWEVFEDRPGNPVAARGEVLAEPALGHSVHVEVTGLRPDTWYAYRFTVPAAASMSGRARTLPAEGSPAARLRLAYASCHRWEHGYFAAYRHMRRDAPDLVAFVGDYIYEMRSSRAKAVRTHELPPALTLGDYRARYALYKSDPDLQAMHAACPWIVTWDDHEVENNYAGERSMAGTGPFRARRIASYQAYYEHMPLRAATMLHGVRGLQAEEGLRIYQYMDFGQLARLYMVDNRQYRDQPLCPRDPGDEQLLQCLPAETRQRRSMLGRGQEEWLDRSLKDAARAGIGWNVIHQQTRFTPSNYRRGKGGTPSPSTWDGFADARQSLIDSIAGSRARNPVIIGGDIHRNWVANVHRDPYDVRTPVVASEFTGTSITSRNPSKSTGTTLNPPTSPHCLLTNAALRGYGLADFTPRRATVQLRVLDDVERRDANVSTLATFAVNDGQPAIQRA